MTTEMTWEEFCRWLVDGQKRVATSKDEDERTTLSFTDGSTAIFASKKTAGTMGFSEYTPGSDGYLVPPTVTVIEKESNDG